MVIKKGDILVGTWGYDQTNANFFVVVGKTPKSVKIREIKSKTINGPQGSMTGHAVPIKSSYKGPIMTRRIYKSSYGEMVNTYDSIGYARKWNGKPVPISWYG